MAEEDLDQFPNAFEFIELGEETVKMTRAELKLVLKDPIVIDGWNEWCRYKRYGFPLGRGIYAEPYRWTVVIDIIETEFSAWEARETKEKSH